jgi:hypothetical protein
MKKVALVTIISILILSNSCISKFLIVETSGLSKDEINSIPKGTSTVFVKKQISPDNLYEESAMVLVSRGHRIEKEDKDRLYIATEGKDVGESTQQRMFISITEKNGTSTAKILTEWNGGAEAQWMATIMAGTAYYGAWQPAKFETGRPSIAIAESVVIAKLLNGSISYE